jgi:hypothetical protein
LLGKEQEMAEEGTEGTAGLYSAASAYLNEVEYPCSKADLVNHAASHGAPQILVDALDRLPEQEYLDFAQVVDRFSQVNP